MIRFIKGNILNANTAALINTVNIYGVMGKGIALAFKQAYKGNYKAYRAAYDAGELAMGKIFVHETGLEQPAYILNFPTKKHWRNPSQLEYIETGLDDLIQIIKEKNIKSVAIPPLGCGNGGLHWKVVKPLILEKIKPLIETVNFMIYEPGFIGVKKKVKAVQRLTPARAMFLTLMRQYELLGEDLNTLVVQKLAFLLQSSGEPLRLNFDKGIYGPFAPNLNKVLESLSPYYIQYKGELNNPQTTIQLVQGKKAETKQFVEEQLDFVQRQNLEKVQTYIDGFENSFGLELLATVAYAMQQCPHCTKEEIIDSIHNWTKRKKELMSAHLIGVAYERVTAYQ